MNLFIKYLFWYKILIYRFFFFFKIFQVFIVIFVFEVFFKLIVFSFMYYFRDGWNCFDFLIVFFSFLEMVLDGVFGLLVFRSFCLVSIFNVVLNFVNFVKRKIIQFLYIMMKCSLKRFNFRLYVYLFFFKEELCMQI